MTDTQSLEALHLMLKSRIFEQHIVKLFASGKMHGTTHLNIGQEACHAGVALALNSGDWIVPTHRCHGYNIATGSSPFAMFSEMFGSSYGLCKGLGGSMHMSDAAHHNLGSSAVVASGVALAIGLSLAQLKLKMNTISVALFGDGATSRGVLHECLNMASIWGLPTLFFLENNGYGMSSKSTQMISTDSLISRAQGYNIAGEKVDGNNVNAVYEACCRARDYIINNKKPYMIEAITYRSNGHSKSDPCKYRTREEEQAWTQKDPIKFLKDQLIKKNIIDNDSYKEMISQNVNFMQDEEDKAQKFKDVRLTLDEAQKYVFAESEVPVNTCKDFHRAYGREAIREAIFEEAQRDPSVYLIGEDIGLYGGCFKVTGDLYSKISSQIIETPISEEGFGGMAVGASMLGLRPIVEIMYGDFATLISDSLINHASKLRFMSAGQFKVPIVFRLPMGCGTGHGAQHSQSLESLFTNVPGLKVVAPSTPRKAKALLKASIRDNNPVVFVEYKLMYDLNGEIGDENDIMELGKCDIERNGDQLTLISYGYMSQVCRLAINEFVLDHPDKIGAIEFIDLCSLKPLDNESLINSVRKTHNAIIVQEAPKFGGYSNEISTLLNSDKEIFKTLNNPICVLGGKEIPIPFNRELEKIAIPTVLEINEKLKEILI
ncbi:MAG: pyruvate dehydrogenase [Spirochaetaceae bacterium]|nr:pyruvate dehydrogenase [Spirochaetaceae bacterium]